MRSLKTSLFALSLSLGLMACGPSEEVGASLPPEAASQVEQGIGSTPDCGLGGTLQSQTLWGATCGACTEVGGDGSWPSGAWGRKGTLQQRCCSDSGCTGWKTIRPVCGYCELN